MDALKLKTLLSIVIIAIGALLIPFVVTNSDAMEQQASGFLIDFGDWDVKWTEMDMQNYSNPYYALEFACQENDFTHTVEDGIVREINGVFSDDTSTWNLWTISKNSTTWVKESNTDNVNLSNYVIAAWAFCDEQGTPTIAVDKSGQSIYGYPQANRIETLTPALTEVAGSIRAINALVGTDSFSQYPPSVVSGKDSGKIKIVGGYTNPSYEAIVAQRPDIVFCDGYMYAQYLVAERLRNTGFNAIIMDGGDSVQGILSNIYIMGVVMGYEMASIQAIMSLEYAVNEITNTVYSSPNAKEVSVMLAISADKSPWVTGSTTYIDDLSSMVMGRNVFESQYQWVQINSEMIPAENPAVIIIYTPEYNATQGEYDSLISSLSSEWRATDAFKNGKIYLVCGSAGELALNPSPRYAQLMEITARILHPDVFTDIEMPNYIGNNYKDYLTFTKDLDFNN